MFCYLATQKINMIIDLCIYTDIDECTNMATFTISAPKELHTLKKKYPKVNWNEVMKQGILKKLNELQKFEELQKKGEL